MKAAVLWRPGVVEIDQVDVPKIGPCEILVEMKVCGVCGTDVEKVQGRSMTPQVLGHEVSGRVAQVGSRVEGYQEGDRVFVHHHVPCYSCHYCRHGDYTMCDSFPRSNLDPCGFAEFFRVPETNVARGAVLKLPQGVSYEIGALIEPTACCIKAIGKSEIQPGDCVLVLGAGPAGLTHILLLKAFGITRVFASDISEFRLNAARRFGAQDTFNPELTDVPMEVRKLTEGTGVDVAIVATGKPEAIVDGVKAVRKGGTVCLFGAPKVGSIVSYDTSDLFIREVRIVPSYSTSEIETNIALRLIASGRIDLTNLITHRFDLAQTAQAIEYARSGKDCLKVAVVSSA